MTEPRPIIFACSCDATMPLRQGALKKACAGFGDVTAAEQLCRRELDRFKNALGGGGPVLVGCTQEQPVFEETAEELGFKGALRFANIRESAGWSDEAARAGAKIAALFAAADEPMPAVPFVEMTSGGVALILGRGEAALEAARELAGDLDITVLLTPGTEAAPPAQTTFPVAQGMVRNARGHLGAFELTVDRFAASAPSSRAKYTFGPGLNGAVSHCDIIIDLTGGTPLFPAHETRDGYLRADPGDTAGVAKIIRRASGLTGTFDKPRYIDFNAGLCAHSRSRITGCTRCLDLCPTGAITPAGDHVAIDPHVCAGCGACAAVCPTGAASYALPPADALMRRLRALLRTYRAAGGADALVLLHDAGHGAPLIDALARAGNGLPARVLPVAVNEVSQLGLETIAAIFAYGAAGAALLTPDRPGHAREAVAQLEALANTVLSGLGFGAALTVISTDDPFALRQALDALPQGTPSAKPADFAPAGPKRHLLELALAELHAAAPAPAAVIALPKTAPFGAIQLDVENCTLCLACVSACPVAALSDNPERPLLAFDESLCVQCGLCAATCPEKVITLTPQIDFSARRAPKVVLKQEEPFHCISCGKPFGTKSSVEKVYAKLKGAHWMYSGEGAARLELIKMCEDCRVGKSVAEAFDPHQATARPRVRTAEDYLRERAKGDDEFG